MTEGGSGSVRERGGTELTKVHPLGLNLKKRARIMILDQTDLLRAHAGLHSHQPEWADRDCTSDGTLDSNVRKIVGDAR